MRSCGMEVERERRGDNEMLVNKIIYFWVHRKLLSFMFITYKMGRSKYYSDYSHKASSNETVVHKLVSIK